MSTVPVAAPVLEGVDVAASRKRGVLVPILIGIIVLGVLAAVGWFFLAPKLFPPSAPTPAAPVEMPVKHTVSLGAVVVNLKGEARRYLRVNVGLGVPAHADGKAIEEHKSQLLDLLVSAFSAAELETLTSEEGKTQLKASLLERMHEELHLKKVLKVYFTEFVIQ
jgi:flagellar basal body-associated protein FliL